VFEPQVRKPFCFTLLSVAWAEAPVANRLAVRPKAIDTRAVPIIPSSPALQIRPCIEADQVEAVLSDVERE
jgi:hypothetical protein